MNQAFDPLNIIILVVAVIIFLRLRSVLGSRTGHEKRFDPLTPVERETPAEVDPAKKEGKVIHLPGHEPEAGPEADAEPVWKGYAEEGSDLAAGLGQIAAADPSFNPGQFADGAKIAYEMIVSAFAEGDRKALRPLLSDDVYQGFADAIEIREQQGHTMENQFVGIDKAEITGAAMAGRKALVTMSFVSQMIKATRDRSGQIVDGDATLITKVSDIWTFERDTASGDPNWQLAATDLTE